VDTKFKNKQMKKKFQEQVNALIEDPEKLLEKKPYIRGVSSKSRFNAIKELEITEKVKVTPNKVKFKVVDIETLVKELDPYSHDVLFDDNVPSIVVKLSNGGYSEIQFKKLSVAFQQNIRDKKVLHLCGNPTEFMLLNEKPTDLDYERFESIKQLWIDRNIDGLRSKMVARQMSYGDAGVLFYMDRNDAIKGRVLSFEDGYTLISHNDSNGDRLIESVTYVNDKGEQVIDSYDDTTHYKHVKKITKDKKIDGWTLESQEAHGFTEIPLVTKRGKVAWDNAQPLIDTYENLYNIYVVIERRHGWGILYIKGQYDNSKKKIAGNIVLQAKQSSSLEGGDSDAKYLTPPTGEGFVACLNSLFEQIQISSKTTFILPKDISMSGDISGVAVQLTQAMDIESANENAIEWTNVLNKMVRLFNYGVKRELVETGADKIALTKEDSTKVRGFFKVWMPRSDYEFNSMLTALKQSGVISSSTATERCTLSNPDEHYRLTKQIEEEVQAVLSKEEASAKIVKENAVITNTATNE